MVDADELLINMRTVIEYAGLVSTELCDFITAESLPIADVMSDWADHHPSKGGPIEEQAIVRLIEHRQTARWHKASRRFSELELSVLADWQKLEIKALTFSINALMIQ